MARLVDAKALEKQIKEAFKETNPFLMGQMLRWVRIQKTIDAVPVVRCKDCKAVVFSEPTIHFAIFSCRERMLTMTDRETLVEVLTNDNCPLLYMQGDVGGLADYLIANGVTFAKEINVPSWIPVTERLPECMDQYLCIVLRPIPGGKYVREMKVLWCDHANHWSCEGLIVTHWMPLPKPPKEEDDDS